MSEPLRFLRGLVMVISVSLVGVGDIKPQYPANYHYTLLPAETVDELIAASSGELAWRHIVNLAPYTQPRYGREFPGKLRESEYIMGKLREYGLENTLDMVGTAMVWRGLKGTLREVSPGNAKIADFIEMPEMLVEGSQPASLRAELIWAGEGSASFFANNRDNLKGKIVVTSSSPNSVNIRALNAGAAGTISFYSPRPLTDPLQIPNLSIQERGFAFMLPPREGIILRDRLERGEKIVVEVNVDSRTEQTDLLVPACVIRGTDPDAGEIIFTAHLFEGYVKMGANDNMSGSAVILEVARILSDLIGSGRIPPPVRTIRFLWVPEFSGTIPWVNQNLERTRKALCNINLDMVGLNLRENSSFFCLHRSGFSTASFVNDVMENYFRYVGETNVEGITDNLGRRGFARRITAPTGTDDPFYYRVLSLHGSSDNAVFNDWSINVPGIKMITWPDKFYHSSEDNPDKCDPTQLRRAVFISAAGAYTIASANDRMAARILMEQYSGASVRLGIEMAKSADIVNRADKNNLTEKYRRAVFNIEGVAMAEKAAMEKIRQLSDKPGTLTVMESRKTAVDNILREHLSALREVMVQKAAYLGMPAIVLTQDNAGKAAMKIIPSPTEKAGSMGNGGDRRHISSLAPAFLAENRYSRIVNTSEAAGLANGKRNLLEIKKMLDAQFETESPLQDLVNYFKVLKEAGLMKY